MAVREEEKPEGKGKGAFTDKGVQKAQEDRITALEGIVEALKKVVFDGAPPEGLAAFRASSAEAEKPEEEEAK